MTPACPELQEQRLASLGPRINGTFTNWRHSIEPFELNALRTCWIAERSRSTKQDRA